MPNKIVKYLKNTLDEKDMAALYMGREGAFSLVEKKFEVWSISIGRRYVDLPNLVQSCAAFLVLVLYVLKL